MQRHLLLSFCEFVSSDHIRIGFLFVSVLCRIMSMTLKMAESWRGMSSNSWKVYRTRLWIPFMSSEIYIPVQDVQVISRVNFRSSQGNENEFSYIILRLSGMKDVPWSFSSERSLDNTSW